MEIILAFSLFTLFTISIFTLNTSLLHMKQWSSDELAKLKYKTKEMDEYIKNRNLPKDASLSLYGNESMKLSFDPFDITLPDYNSAYGRNTCSPRIDFDISKLLYYPDGIMLGVGNNSTDIEVRNNIVYLSTDSTLLSQPDLFIIDSIDFNSPYIISSINTGPGIRAIDIAGPYIFIANSSTNSQFQIVDIHDRTLPTLIYNFKIPLPEASTTPTRARSVFYKDGYVYLGTEKWDGGELYIFDVHDVMNPYIVGSFETSTLINDIYVNGNILYLATSDIYQMRVLDITDKSNPTLAYPFSPSGWQTQEGRIFDYFESSLALGRTVGGFNNIYNHEAFVFSTTSSFASSALISYVSHDIPGGVYGAVLQPSFIFLITHSVGHEFQVWDRIFLNKIYEKSLGFQPVKFACDWSEIYFATGNEKGFAVMTL